MSVFDHVGLLVALIGVSSRRTLGRLRAGVLRQLRSEGGGRGGGREGGRGGGRGRGGRVTITAAACSAYAERRCVVRYAAERAAGGRPSERRPASGTAA